MLSLTQICGDESAAATNWAVWGGCYALSRLLQPTVVAAAWFSRRTAQLHTVWFGNMETVYVHENYWEYLYIRYAFFSR